jgi:hypothetical protein
MRAAQLIQAALLGFWCIGQTGMGATSAERTETTTTDILKVANSVRDLENPLLEVIDDEPHQRGTR